MSVEVQWTDTDPVSGAKRFVSVDRFAGQWRFRVRAKRRDDWRTQTQITRDLWESLLQLAVILFTLDVGVRRIQIDREEWLKATQTLRRWVFFWRVKPRPVEADESLVQLGENAGDGDKQEARRRDKDADHVP